LIFILVLEKYKNWLNHFELHRTFLMYNKKSSQRIFL
jgi:hypothetical protein